MTAHPPTLWWTSLADAANRWQELERALPAEEQERAARFRVDVARHRFVLARTMLRQVLGSILDIHSSALTFEIGDRGKPHLIAPSVDDVPHFNLSHSGELAVVVVAAMEVGVDVESLREMSNAEKLARRFFDPLEQSVVGDLQGRARDRAFLRIWTQKEAYLKATGLGVGMPLREIETEPDPEMKPGLRAVSGDREEARRWSMMDAVVPNAVCTVAARTRPLDLAVHRWVLG